MGTHRPLALFAGSLLLVVLATGVAAAETGDGGTLVGMLERLVEALQSLLDLLEASESLPSVPSMG
jgi:hypothetical protein